MTEVIRLNETAVSELQLSGPDYDRRQLQTGIVHLGVGNFHRGHQAVYTDDLLADGDLRWGIVGASLRTADTQQRLIAQDQLYTVQTRSEAENQSRIVGSISQVLLGTNVDQLRQLIAAIAAKNTQVVTMTITELGYCQQQGELDLKNSAIQHDIANPDAPISAPGVITAGLRARAAKGHGPLTIVSCDNLAANGAVTQQVVSNLMALQAPNMQGWIGDNVAFPSSMVDRIVPATTPDDIQQATLALGYRDDALVICEPFTQWVIEDQFAGIRPAWDIGGAQFVSSVTPFESAKLRLLNATHSALAYVGLLLDYEYIHEVMQVPELQSFARQLMMDEVSPVIAPFNGMELREYISNILGRFSNSAVPYKTSQVATDGSQKLQQRIVPTIYDGITQGTSTRHLTAVIACWLKCLGGQSSSDRPIVFKDEGAAGLRDIAAAGDYQALVNAFTTQHASLLGSNQQAIAGQLLEAIQRLDQQGPIGLVSSLQTAGE